jgi:hypothetical protein
MISRAALQRQIASLRTELAHLAATRGPVPTEFQRFLAGLSVAELRRAERLAEAWPESAELSLDALAGIVADNTDIERNSHGQA